MKSIRITFILILFVLSFQTFAQHKLKLFIIPTDSVGIVAFKNSKLVYDVKDSLDGLRKLKQFEDSRIESGFLSFNVDSVEFDSLRINAYIFSGFQYLTDSLQLTNIPPGILNKTDFGFQSSKTKHFSLKSYLKFRNEIITYYENNGFPFAQIWIDSFNIHNQYVLGRLELKKNDLIKIDSIVLKGNPKISHLFFNHYLQIKPGVIYNQSQINQIGKLIGELSYIEQVKPLELEYRKNKADIYLYLKNKPANYFDGMIGFSSGTEQKPDFQMTGDISLMLVNSFKIGEKISLYWDKYNAQSQNLKLGFQFPYLFLIPVGIDFRFGLEKFNIDYLNTSLYGAADYSFSANHKISAYITRKKSYLINNENDADTNYADYSRFTAGLGFYLNNTDYSYNPRKGYLVEISTGYGNRTNVSSKSGSLAELAFKAEFYLQLGRMATIAFLNKSSGIFGDGGFYQNEMFKIGGINSLRGFDEQSILASTYSIFSIEPRLIIGKNSSVYLFSDLAWYQSLQIDKVLTDYPLGFGLGMNMDTKAGIFKINYALGKQQGNPIKISSSKVHFGFYARF